MTPASLRRGEPGFNARGPWLRQQWADLFHADCEVLLYDLTSTYFEGEMEHNPKAKR